MACVATHGHAQLARQAGAGGDAATVFQDALRHPMKW
jgi:hypothetical protein